MDHDTYLLPHFYKYWNVYCIVGKLKTYSAADKPSWSVMYLVPIASLPGRVAWEQGKYLLPLAYAHPYIQCFTFYLVY